MNREKARTDLTRCNRTAWHQFFTMIGWKKGVLWGSESHFLRKLTLLNEWRVIQWCLLLLYYTSMIQIPDPNWLAWRNVLYLSFSIFCAFSFLLWGKHLMCIFLLLINNFISMITLNSIHVCIIMFRYYIITSICFLLTVYVFVLSCFAIT